MRKFSPLENKSTIKDRLLLFIKHLGISKNEFAEKTGFGQGALSKIVSGKEGFGVNKLVNIFTTYPQLNKDWLLFGTGEMLIKTEAEKKAEERREKISDAFEEFKARPKSSSQAVSVRPVLVTVDSNLKENITLVPVTAKAGYLVGYADPEFVESLPAFAIPGFSNDIYRAFEVEGFSMLQFQGAGLYPTDIVIASYVENPLMIRDNRVYVIVSDQGLIIKRCINRLKTNDTLICTSDNPEAIYQAQNAFLKPHEIREVWEFKAKISRHIPKSTDIVEDITDLKAQYTLISHRLMEMEMILGRMRGE